MDLSPGRVTEPCRVRAGRMSWVVEVEGIAFSLNVFWCDGLDGQRRMQFRVTTLLVKKRSGGENSRRFLVVGCWTRNMMPDTTKPQVLRLRLSQGNCERFRSG